MSRKHPEGVVLAMTAPDPDIADRKTTVYWRGMDAPTQWSEHQRDAARYADEALALHTLRTAQPNLNLDRLRALHVRAEPALHQRNGGPTTPVITAPPAGTGEPDRPAADPEPKQGDLFGGAQ